MIQTITKQLRQVGLMASALVMVAAGTVFLAPPAPAEAAGGGCPYTRPTLRQGSRGPCVEYLQIMLNNMKPVNSSSPLVEDGIFGTLTDRAVRRYQSVEYISSDGIVGPNTWWRLCRNPESAGYYHYVPNYMYARWIAARNNVC